MLGMVHGGGITHLRWSCCSAIHIPQSISFSISASRWEKQGENPHPERQNRSTGFLLAWRGILEGDFTVR